MGVLFPFISDKLATDKYLEGSWNKGFDGVKEFIEKHVKYSLAELSERAEFKFFFFSG